MIIRFDALGITVSDMAETLRFYRLLGLDVPPQQESEGHVEITLQNGTRLMFDTEETVRSFDPDYQPPIGSGRTSLAFLCRTTEELEARVEIVRSAGYRVRREPFDAFWGQRYATILDPDGTPIDLFAQLTAA